jgi:putative membrane protein
MSIERVPVGVYGVGEEPDPRFSLANERTFLAWTRTSLGMVAGAVAARAPFVALPDWLGVSISALLLALAAVTAVCGCIRWRNTEIAMRLAAPLPGFGVSTVIAVVLLVIVALTATGMIVTAS